MTRSVCFQRTLTQEELTDLEKFLRCWGKGISTGIQLEGFFCAILTAPQPIAPYLWSPIIFGEIFYFKNNDDAIYILDLVLRFLHQVELQKRTLIEVFLSEVEAGTVYQNYELRGMWRIGYAQGKTLWTKEDALVPMTLIDCVGTEIELKNNLISRNN